jgi:type II secretory pathway component PulC
MELVSVTPAIAAERGLRQAAGALVYRISPTISDQTGLIAGDIILQINNQAIRSAQEVAQAIDYYGSRSYLQVLLQRQGQLLITRFAVR